jgi:hypothetical protein
MISSSIHGSSHDLKRPFSTPLHNPSIKLGNPSDAKIDRVANPFSQLDHIARRYLQQIIN